MMKKRRHSPSRSCISCRTVKPKNELIRFAFLEDRGVVRDDTGNLGGRGAYVCSAHAHLEAALAKGKFVKALRISAPHTEGQGSLRIGSLT